MKKNKWTNHYVIVAGEASGDILGANLITHLKKLDPNAEFVGIGGPLMQAQGLDSIVPMDRLSVMGLFEVLGRLRELLGIRKSLREQCLANPPKAFIGIDSPDFNLPLERKLKQAGIKTVHYVSPSVWAWRKKRIFKIKESVDLMLALFPFELDIYHEHEIPVTCVGHTLADHIDLETDQVAAKTDLALPSDFYAQDTPVFAVLPGSRGGEVSRLMPLFAQAMVLIKQAYPAAHFIIPAANAIRRTQIEECLSIDEFASILPATHIIDGQSRTVMMAADAILLASGTATLEAMLVKRPMVVAYRFAPLTYAIMSRMQTVDYVALPNLLAPNPPLVPELIQNNATPEALADNLLNSWRDFNDQPHLKQTYIELHKALRKNAGEQAAKAVVELVSKTANTAS
ncbi:lipid-A-disaccharide synthase [Marinomonas agarivorans]|nr:lipid-A-disaccharide synthase [Marinomonas agarivorans]